jgi:hypothetical protein
MWLLPVAGYGFPGDWRPVTGDWQTGKPITGSWIFNTSIHEQSDIE